MPRTENCSLAVPGGRGAGAGVPRPVAAQNRDESLRCSSDGSQPAEEEKVVTTKITAIGLEEPTDCSLDGIANPHAPKLNGPAVRTARAEQSECGPDHDASTLAGLVTARPAPFCTDGVERLA